MYHPLRISFQMCRWFPYCYLSCMFNTVQYDALQNSGSVLKNPLSFTFLVTSDIRMAAFYKFRSKLNLETWFEILIVIFERPSFKSRVCTDTDYFPVFESTFSLKFFLFCTLLQKKRSSLFFLRRSSDKNSSSDEI